MQALDPNDPPLRRGRLRVRSLITMGLFLLALAPGLHADDGGETEAIEHRLYKADALERMGDYEDALKLYEEVLGAKTLPADPRQRALTGAARCHEAVGRKDRAASYWQRIIDDEEMSDQARAWAHRKKAEKVKAEIEAGNGRRGADTAVEEELKRRQAQRRRRARERLRDAREALEARRYDAARSLCFEALTIDNENQEAAALWDEIERLRPDRGDLLRRLIEFFQTAQLEKYQRLRDKIEQLRQDGQDAFNTKKYKLADRILREAIHLIDGSGFLSAGGSLHLDSLETVRNRLIAWLREARDRAAAGGVELEPEPPLPDLEARAGGLSEFYALMARVFSPHEPGQEPLRFYEFEPTGRRAGNTKRMVSSDFFDGLRAIHRAGTLSRARWAERWIRRHVGARWSDPSGAAPARRETRILMRFGNLICAQHREEEHRRIRKLRDAFANVPPAIRVDVHVFAAGAGGAVRVAEQLRVRARRGEKGLDLIVDGQLIEECVRELADLQNLIQLGSAQVLLEGESAISLELTRMTAEHPAFLDTASPPPLTVLDADARYGLWLDLYAEDMPNRTGPGNDRSALSVRARVLQPASPLSSHVVPRSGGGGQKYTRLPVLNEQVREADRWLPHFGTFLMLGLGNPFPKTRETHGELLVLIGTRRQDTPTPDPPRTQPTPRIIPDDAQTKDYPLGPLALDIQDEQVHDDWPALRPSSDHIPAAVLRRERNRHLADLLAQMANVEKPTSSGPAPVIVHEGHVTATLGVEEQHRLQQAVLRMRSHENALYEIEVRSIVVPQASWETWSAEEGLERNDRGNIRASGAARQALETHLAPLFARKLLFNTQRTLLAGATQQVAHMSVRPHDITKDLRVRLRDHGVQRYTAIPGIAEEGLIVEVRPGIEQADTGLRSVYVRVRAARLEKIEARAYPRATQAAARYDVPIWFSGTDGAYSRITDAEIMSDEMALFLPLAVPGASDQRIVVEVSVRKAQ